MKRTREELKEQEVKYRVYQKDKSWFGYRACPKCFKEIKQTALERGVLLRNIRNADNKNILCLQCSKSGENNPFFGKSHSLETKTEMSEHRTGKACGENNSMANPIHRNSVSIALKEKYNNGELDFLKKIQSDNAFKNQANGKLKSAPISKAEIEIRVELEKLGFEVQSQFNIGSLRYDLFVKNKNILIEYNGDYWHCNPTKYKADYFHKKKQLSASDIWRQDLRKKELAEKSGYKLFIIWEHDYMFNKEKEIQKIIKNL
jgi:G:T-mismatch repair DNA endonuclease (very short patch repair protein)